MEQCRTLKNPVVVKGIGLHCGQEIELRLLPTENLGIVLRRTDNARSEDVPAAPASILSTHHATTLGAGDSAISTTEHLMAALWMKGITHCRIELDGPEIPILDGSALPWWQALEAAETVALPQARPTMKLRQAMWASQGESAMIGLPADELHLSVACEYSASYIGKQIFDGKVDASTFAEHIAAARTFTLEEWLEPLRARGLIRGGSLDNAVVLGADGPSSAWRMPDEIARHKTLDVLGDIMLMGAPHGAKLHAHLVVVRGGHGLHHLWMQECLRQEAVIFSA